MRPQDAYRCMTCGSTHGQPSDHNSENWWWRITEWGRVGPFHSTDCADAFTMGKPAGFTLREAMLLLEVAHRTNKVPS